MNQVDQNTFHFPGRVREFGSVMRFSADGDTVTMQYSGIQFERVSSPFDDTDESAADDDANQPVEDDAIESADDGIDESEESEESEEPVESEVVQLRFVIGNTEFTRNGTPHQMESAPFVDSAYNRTMIPLSFVAEVFGAEVEWVEESQTATIVLGEISLAVSTVESLSHGIGMAQDVNGCIFIPLRYIASAFGAQVSWDGANQAVYVYIDSVI